MSESLPPKTTDQQERPHRRRRRWAWGLVLATVLLMIVGIVFWTGSSPKLPLGPIRLIRGDAGWRQESNVDESGLRWEAQTGKIEAQNNLSSSAMESRPGRSRFACSRMVIMNRSDHLLMQRLGPCLLEELKKPRLPRPSSSSITSIASAVTKWPRNSTNCSTATPPLRH